MQIEHLRGDAGDAGWRATCSSSPAVDNKCCRCGIAAAGQARATCTTLHPQSAVLVDRHAANVVALSSGAQRRFGLCSIDATACSLLLLWRAYLPLVTMTAALTAAAAAAGTRAGACYSR